MMIHKQPFSATNHRGILVPKTDKVNLDYLKYVLEPMFRELKKGREGANGENEYTSLPPFMIKNVKIILPITEEGTPNLEVQAEIANKYLALEQNKRDIAEKLDLLVQQKILL